MNPSLSLTLLNAASDADASAMLDGIYEHSPWIAQAALAAHPGPQRFASLAALKQALADVVRSAPRERQRELILAHPDLAGKAMSERTLTAESTDEQNRAGLTACTPEELARIRELNAAYRERFGLPFVLAVRGPRGDGLAKQAIFATFERRLANTPGFEFDEALRNIHRIAEIRLNERFGYVPAEGNAAWDWLEALARHTEAAEPGALTVTYLSDAHRACAEQIAQRMRECGFDDVQVDALGNVVGRYHPAQPGARYLLTGSHYDTVPNGGKYDGRLGIAVPMACVQRLARAGRRLAVGLELVAFAEEEGQRFPVSFLTSGALAGTFDTGWLSLRDAAGISLGEALAAYGTDAQAIGALARDPARYAGYVEVHIEQGPVLNAMGLPLGVVSSINGSRRYLGEVAGVACHAGTTPMNARHDAAMAVAEWMLEVERAGAAGRETVATVGSLQVPGGAVNVVPGLCRFSLDVRAPDDARRDALADALLAELERVCARRGVSCRIQETLRAAAAPSDARWMARWEQAVVALGLPVHRMPSGAGHDAMCMHAILPQAMLFVRGENAGISHNPLESTTSDDIQLAIDAFSHLLDATGEGDDGSNAPF
ncbi:2-oxo-4-hydroxy-4-carboxy-5-ureidoimidazoline decarboxylase [Verticiella sediminum]|uniref:2-oxo-4-hydroxy-4-carboxy-5-ureidoimidazoline decarboxylase n=1 Tax=Verticiella sediminum TaxID=1247510 RepID=A0A556AYR1_9BURK|nr:2-oxo-4-hydroxy-4-carboxy-5-ureidoimidazoline decarboxylase [Verticiella sediminum]TSH98077.1 2-oxo-4-hydroxy-4-carboxy-5-ureidoimidazoline decarboxylase [Verticiella sediminum]